MKVLKQHKSFGGVVQFCEHDSRVTRTKMAFSLYLPERPPRGCLIWLSGLSCTEENFIAKAAAQRYLNAAGLMLVCPDTSPRGLHLPGEHDSYDFGSGASFYVDATTEGYRDHYQMATYITGELYQLIADKFKVANHISIFGHSMGGHGALVLGLRHRDMFRSVSAFSPIVNPSECAWGKKAFAGFLGSDESTWHPYDATKLIASGEFHPSEILIDQGTSDQFLAEKQLLTPNLLQAALNSKQKINLRMQEGYDHSYYFISTFVEDHIKFHAERM